MLERIIQGKEDAKFILLQDNIKTDGNPLLNAFIVESCKRSENVFLVQYDNPKWSPQLKELEKNGSIKCFDGFTDPLDWNCHSYVGNLIGFDLEKPLSTLQSLNGGIVIINSLSPLIINKSVNEVYGQLINLKIQKGCKIIALIHSDIHDNLEIKIIEKLSDAILKLSAPPKSQNKTSTLCSTFLRKSSGKLSVNNEHFKVDSNLNVILEELKVTRVEPITQPIDPASNLTFNLTLKDDEKVARQELVLPYTLISNANSGGGKIIYNHDSVDDIDEDDPDDDLDI